MKKINHINQYLLEKYPTIWNTKLVWMLLTAIVIHILFFFIGYTSHTNPETLQSTNAVGDYFNNGLIYIQLIISILMIVTWLIMMFKNNAFKNFYPISKLKLFFQFFQYFIIIFACITFYFSYMFGFKLFINQKYNDDKMTKNIELINKVYPFLAQNTTDFTLDNRLTPKPFFDLYCEREINNIHRDKKYYVYYDQVYQYFSTYSKTSYKKNKDGEFIIPEPENSNNAEIAYTENTRNSEVFHFKKDVVDVSPYIKTTGLTFYNYSTIFYDKSEEPIYNSNINNYQEDALALDQNLARKKREKINQSVSGLLDRKNPQEISALLSDFLAVSKDYKIKNNLDQKSWIKMVYNPENLEVRYFTKKYLPKPNESYDPNYSGDYAMALTTDAVANAAVDDNGNIVNAAVAIKDFNPEINKQLSPENYFKRNLTNYYYFSDDLKSLLVNVDTIKTKDYVSEAIHFCLWIAFALSAFIFSFRILGLRSLLFSIISAGVLALAIVLIGLSSRLIIEDSGEFFLLYLVLLIGIVILAVPFLMMGKIKKFISSIFMTISMNGFPLFLLLIVGIITIYQKKDCSETLDLNGNYKSCTDLFDTFGAVNISWIILILSFIFIYFYTSILQKWKALPE